MTTLFFFGSLRDPALLEIVLDRIVEPRELVEARAQGYQALALDHEAYPYLATRPSAKAEGVVITRLSREDIARLEYFEEAEYGLAPIHVETDAGPVEAHYFRAADKLGDKTRDLPWDFAAWQRNDRAVALEAASELMGHFGIVAVEDVDKIWQGIMMRARMRVRAKTKMPVMGHLRRDRGPQDIDHKGITRPYTRYFAVEEHRLHHRRFDGSWSPEILRTAVTSGDAVTVLPYDPVRDCVLLIEQFRAPMLARGDICPWGIEVIAGRLDQESCAQTCARREAMEEAGLELGRMEQAAAYYSTPGFASEHLTSFVGEAVLTRSEGVFGLASEDEDIRAFSVTLDAALDGVTTGEINNGPAILSLLWLQANRERLVREWATGA
ncbi:MAG: gamma-glutamylcyclotransferase [Paracoccaceae bacterium]